MPFPRLGWRPRPKASGSRKLAWISSTMFALAILAGAFIGVGAIFCTTVLAGTSTLPYGVARLLGGLVFTTGLILVVVGGAELFTGNNLIVMAFASSKVTLAALLRNWGIVYVGNFVGSILTAYIMFLSKQYTFGSGAVGLTALNIGNAKCSLDVHSGDCPGHHVQRPGVHGRVAVLQRAQHHRQDPVDHPAHHGLCRRRL